jgi:hypothetical protein
LVVNPPSAAKNHIPDPPIVPILIVPVTGAVNLENGALSLVEDQEIQLDSTVEDVFGDRGAVEGIPLPDIDEEG